MVKKYNNNKVAKTNGTCTTDIYESRYLENRDINILREYFDNNFNNDKQEFEESKSCIARTKGIKDVSSNEELAAMVQYVRWLGGWIPEVVHLDDIKKHILEDMGNINIFKGKITPEFFDSKVNGYLEELEDTEEFILNEAKHYHSLNDFEFFNEEPGCTIVPCGGVITGENRYIYCFADIKNNLYFGKEFVVDKEGKIYDGTDEWIGLGWYERLGKDIFWNTYLGIDMIDADCDVCYVPSLIALYTMAKYLSVIRDNRETLNTGNI